jgi:hypothetical protein
MNWSYGVLKDVLSDSKDSGTHREAVGMLGYVDCRRRRAQTRGFWRTSAEGNEKFDRYRTPRLDSFDMDTTGGTVELLSYSTELEMAPIGGAQVRRS